MGGNDVNNAENVFSQTMNVETTQADTLNTNRTIVSNELNIGGNRIVSVGSDIEIYAATVKPSGTGLAIEVCALLACLYLLG
jgi:hypothetical protein